VVDRDLGPCRAHRTGAVVIRIRHESLPSGLSAVVRRRPGGDTDIVVSTLLNPARQRAAVRVGLRAARTADRRSVLPVPLLGVLALGWASCRAIVRAVRLHPAALVAAAGAVTAVTAAAVVIAVVPHQHATTGGGHQAAGALPAPAPAPARTAGRPTPSTQPAAGPHATTQPTPSVVPVADHPVVAASGPTPTAGAPAPGASSAQSPTATPQPQPQPSPSPSAGGGGGGVCLDLLGLRVCL
jgi:hypothetical protein